VTVITLENFEQIIANFTASATLMSYFELNWFDFCE